MFVIEFNAKLHNHDVEHYTVRKDAAWHAMRSLQTSAGQHRRAAVRNAGYYASLSAISWTQRETRELITAVNHEIVFLRG